MANVKTKYHRASALCRLMHGDENTVVGELFVDHAYRVAESMDTYAMATVAYLHKIVEYTPMELDDVNLFFGSGIAGKVDTLTRRRDERYIDFIKRVCGSRDLIAISVMLASLRDYLHEDRVVNPVDCVRGDYVMMGRMLTKAFNDLSD